MYFADSLTKDSKLHVVLKRHLLNIKNYYENAISLLYKSMLFLPSIENTTNALK